MKKKIALISGITGQDGSYLAELLLKKKYIVHGIKRKSSSFNTQRVDHLYVDPHNKTNFFLHYGDLADGNGLMRLLREIEPHEVYNLAAQSHVRVSFDQPTYTADVTAVGTLRLLEAIRDVQDDTGCQIRFYQASTSELYGNAAESPQSETTPFRPRSPYGVAKLYAFWITVNYRDAYEMHASNGILFNHESPTRGETFVTRKITRSVVAIEAGLEKKLYLGNLDALRDWGDARDYVEGMWMMLQQDKPGDYVLATGEQHSVREFVELAFAKIGRQITWEGHGVDELGLDKDTGDILVEVDPQYFRPTDVDKLLGNSEKAKRILGWTAKHTFNDLVTEMVEADRELLRNHSNGW